MTDNNQLHRCIGWYDKTTELMVGDEELKGIGLKELQRLFDVPEDDPMVECWAIGEEHVAALQGHVEHVIDLQAFDYFLEAYAPE